MDQHVENETNVEGTTYDYDDGVVLLADPRCVEDVYIRVGYEDRINGTKFGYGGVDCTDFPYRGVCRKRVPSGILPDWS